MQRNGKQNQDMMLMLQMFSQWLETGCDKVHIVPRLAEMNFERTCFRKPKIRKSKFQAF
ncbi:hypothetical protein BC943DRAFT_319443 [Umbelopsis sp. AD052]|nr:hypothetical protein BC943DRAFT_319443 [Umbelopsis sp. AD052]